MVNTWTVPQPLDASRLKNALASTLQVMPLNASKLVTTTNHDMWTLQLVNQAIPLTIGTTDSPGPFSPDWTGEKDPGKYLCQRLECGSNFNSPTDYYDELPRGGGSSESCSDIALTRLKVTTWRKTGQTSVMLSQSYNLGSSKSMVSIDLIWEYDV